MMELTKNQIEFVTSTMESSGVRIGGPVEATPIAGGRSNLTFALTDGSNRWVLRCPPLAGRTPSAHDMAREFAVTRRLSQTDVPVPKPVVLCERENPLAGPFTVVEFVDGLTVRTQQDLQALSDAQVAACVDGLLVVFAGLHDVDPIEVGLDGFGRPDAYAERLLRRWSRQWSHVSDSASEATERLARELITKLDDRLPLGQQRVSVVHGDFRIDNTILDRNDVRNVLAIVDWELSTLGDPTADVAMMCAYRHPALDAVLGVSAAWTSDRLPSIEGLAELYVRASGQQLEDWETHLALAYLKLAVIAQGIEHRYRAGATFGPGFASAGGAVPEFFAAGLEHLEGA